MGSTQNSAVVQVSGPHLAFIAGTRRAFSNEEEKFDALIEEWRRLRQPGSSTANSINDAYGQIVAMGWSAVPLLLREVVRKSGHWFTALKWITGENLVTPEMAGNIREIRQTWIRWGVEHGYLSADVQRPVDAAVSSSNA